MSMGRGSPSTWTCQAEVQGSDRTRSWFRVWTWTSSAIRFGSEATISMGWVEPVWAWSRSGSVRGGQSGAESGKGVVGFSGTATPTADAGPDQVESGKGVVGLSGYATMAPRSLSMKWGNPGLPVPRHFLARP